MLASLFVTILISLASGVGLEFSDTVQKLFVSVHNDEIKIEINGSPILTPTFTPRSSADDFAGPTPTATPSPVAASGRFTGCDFEYHKTVTNGEPINVEHNCTSTTKGGGHATTSVDIEANTSGSGNVKNTVDVSVSTN